MNQSSNQGGSPTFTIKVVEHDGKFTASAPAAKMIPPVTATSSRTAINAVQRALDDAILSGKLPH